jgi:hypothetical protein
MDPNEIEQVQETIQTHTETEPVAGSSEDHEGGNPWPHLKEHFSFKQRRGLLSSDYQRWWRWLPTKTPCPS